MQTNLGFIDPVFEALNHTAATSFRDIDFTHFQLNNPASTVARSERPLMMAIREDDEVRNVIDIIVPASFIQRSDFWFSHIGQKPDNIGQRRAQGMENMLDEKWT